MVFSLGRVAKLLVLVAGQAWRANAECAYRLGEFFRNLFSVNYLQNAHVDVMTLDCRPE